MLVHTSLIIEEYCYHPFIDKIMEIALSLNWKTLSIHRYDKSTNFDEHINIYVTQVSFYTIEDITFYCLPNISLKVYSKLVQPTSTFSIDYFDTLVSRFDTQFSISRPYHFMLIALINIRQEKGELLQMFVEHFDKMALNL